MMVGGHPGIMSQPFMVACDDCPFEQAVESREEAEVVAQQHLDQTNHEVVALEMPRTR